MRFRGILALDFDNTLVTDAKGETFLDWLRREVDASEGKEEVPKYHGIRDICKFQVCFHLTTTFSGTIFLKKKRIKFNRLR